MQVISSHEFYSLLNKPNIKQLKTTYNRPKLLETQDNEIIKIFYPRKKLISSNAYKPYALRFASNAKQLRDLGFETPIINNIQHCPELNTYVLTYKRLQGIDTRVLANNQHPDIINQVARFIAELHNKGVFFRSIHLENLLYQDNGHFALLDIVDVQFNNKPLATYMRFRNLKHFLLIKDDRLFWKNYGVNQFLDSYFQFSKISYISKKILSTLDMYTRFIFKNHR